MSDTTKKLRQKKKKQQALEAKLAAAPEPELSHSVDTRRACPIQTTEHPKYKLWQLARKSLKERKALVTWRFVVIEGRGGDDDERVMAVVKLMLEDIDSCSLFSENDDTEKANKAKRLVGYRCISLMMSLRERERLPKHMVDLVRRRFASNNYTGFTST
jgi:hypothetical protein